MNNFIITKSLDQSRRGGLPIYYFEVYITSDNDNDDNDDDDDDHEDHGCDDDNDDDDDDHDDNTHSDEAALR